MLSNDSDLALRHLEGDPQAFGALVDRYQTPVLTFIHHTVEDPKRAEELAQEVFIRAYRQLHRFDTATDFSIWLYGIASHLVWNELGGRPRFARAGRWVVSGWRGVRSLLRGVSDLLAPVSSSHNGDRRSALGRPTQ